MIISADLARKYASYRARFLGGAAGLYAGRNPSPAGPDPCAGQAFPLQPKNAFVPFLGRPADDPATAGAYLHVDTLDVGDATQTPEAMEAEAVTDIAHGDNLIFAAFAALNFACEYAITLDGEPLVLAANIVKSLRRLGTYQKGYSLSSGGGEPGGPPFGYLLRHDSADADDDQESICAWTTSHLSARNLEPSYDQYNSLLAALALARRVLAEAQVPDPQKAAVGAVSDDIAALVGRVISYLDGSLMTVLWQDEQGALRGGSVARGGSFCQFAAYPFATIASRVLGHDVGINYGFPSLPVVDADVKSTLDGARSLIRDAMTGFFSPVSAEATLIGYILDRIVQGLKAHDIADALGEIEKFIDNVDDAIRNAVGPNMLDITKWATDAIINPLKTALDAWDGRFSLATPFGAGLAKFMHKAFSVGLLTDPVSGAVYQPSLGDVLAAFGLPLALPPLTIDIDIDFDVGGKPGWWPFGWPWSGWHFHRHLAHWSLPIGDLLAQPVPVDFIDPLKLIGTLIPVGDKKDYLRFAAFVSNVGSATFGDNDLDPVEISNFWNNAFFMALTYRFIGLGGDSDAARFQSVMSLLNTAPDTFPKGTDPAHWNKNFRWMWDVDTKVSACLFSGLDFMAPLMVSGSAAPDVAANRAVLIDAMTAKNDQEAEMGPFQLPFQGPIASPIPVFTPHAAGTQTDTVVYVGVVFDRTRGQGQVVLTVPKLDGTTEDLTFNQDDPSRLVAVPLTEAGIVAKQINEFAKGSIVIATSD